MQKSACIKIEKRRKRVLIFNNFLFVLINLKFLCFRYFIGCRSFPTCKTIIWLPSAIKEATVTNEICQTVIIKNLYTNQSLILGLFYSQKSSFKPSFK